MFSAAWDATKTHTEKKNKTQKADFFGENTASKLKMKSPEENSQVKQNLLDLFTKTVTYLESDSAIQSSSDLCASKPFFLRNRSFTYGDI